MYRIALVLLALVWLSPTSFAEPPAPSEDIAGVARSEVIVVGHLDERSIEYVPHARPPGEGKATNTMLCWSRPRS